MDGYPRQIGRIDADNIQHDAVRRLRQDAAGAEPAEQNKQGLPGALFQFGPSLSSRSADGRVIDQIADLVEQIRTNPDSRRLIVSAWNPGELDRMALAPCHAFFQFYVNDGVLSCQLYQRSADLFLGVPFNIASYALLTLMVAQVCDLAPGEFIHTFGDAHLYRSHLAQADKQLARKPLPLPRVRVNPAVKDLFAFTIDDVELLDYRCHGAIKAPISV